MNIDKGIVKANDVYGVPVKVDIVQPSGNKNVRRLIKMNPKGLTVHNTGNKSKGAGDELHGRYLQNLENADKTYVSWHFTVDDDSLTQHLPLNEAGYHAGDGSRGFGNNHTIGIEIAEDGDYKKAEENAIKLMCWLMKEFGFTVEVVQPHRKYSSYNKLCPHRILKSQKDWQSNWDKFQDRVQGEFNSLNKVPEHKSESGISKGDTVLLKSTAKQWDGSSIKNSYMDKEYKVHSVGKNERAVLTIDNVIVYAVSTKYLVKKDDSFLVKVTAEGLNIRSGPSVDYKVKGVIRDKGTYTIIEEKRNWGKLKSGAGWISLAYTKRV